MNSIYEIKDLVFRYQKSDTETIKSVSFNVQEGKIFGLLGPSGAGKSTIQKLLTKLLIGYNGSIFYKGKDLKEYGKDFYEEIGVCFESPVHFNKLTAIENLRYFSSLYKNKVDYISLLNQLNLKDSMNDEVSTFSKGMKVRLNFIRALLNNPKVLFLDEPTNGLDPLNAKIVKNMIIDFKNNGGTVFLSTHLMGDVDELCDDIIFITNGQVTQTANPRDLKLKYGKKEIKVEYIKDEILSVKTFNLVNLGKNQEFIDLLNQYPVETIHTGETTLDDIFIKVMKERNHE